MRLSKLKLEAKVRLQFCAILSQLHRHKEALEQAQEGIKIAHLVVRDTIAVCRFYSRRIDFREKYGEPPSQDPTEHSFSHSDISKPSKANKLEDHSKSSYPFDEDEDKSLGVDIDNISIASINQF